MPFIYSSMLNDRIFGIRTFLCTTRRNNVQRNTAKKKKNIFLCPRLNEGHGGGSLMPEVQCPGIVGVTNNLMLHDSCSIKKNSEIVFWWLIQCKGKLVGNVVCGGRCLQRTSQHLINLHHWEWRELLRTIQFITLPNLHSTSLLSNNTSAFSFHAKSHAFSSKCNSASDRIFNLDPAPWRFFHATTFRWWPQLILW